jgi:DNA-binding NtrC family response regulator
VRVVSPTLSAISVGLCRRGDGTGVAFSAGMVNQETASTAAPISLDDRLRELEASLISWALTASRGNKSKAARLLQVKRSTLGDRINRCGLGRQPETEPAAVTRHAPQAASELVGR